MGVTIDRWQFGTLPHGCKNLITDVPGVRVGHMTLSGGGQETGDGGGGQTRWVS